MADGEADDLLPGGDHAPDHMLVDRGRPMLEIAAELGVAGRRARPGRPHAGLNPRSGNGFA